MGTPHTPHQPHQQHYQQPPLVYGPGGPPISPFAVLSLLLGMGSIPGCFCCVGYPMAALGIICGGVGLYQVSNGSANQASKWMSIAGIAIPFLFFGAYVVLNIALYGVAGFMEAMQNGTDFSQFDSYNSGSGGY